MPFRVERTKKKNQQAIPLQTDRVMELSNRWIGERVANNPFMECNLISDFASFVFFLVWEWQVNRENELMGEVQID